MPKLVIHDNDGHVDDLLSSLLLWLSSDIDLQAIIITNGDCYADQSFAALLKMATYLDLEGAEVAYSDSAVPNPFPDNWRKESYIINELPLFAEIALKKLYQQGRSHKAEQVMMDCLNHSRLPLTIVSTGPLTNIAKLFEYNRHLKSKVDQVVIMGGALHCRGNVEDKDSDGSAEWNIYADSKAAKAVFNLGIPIRMIPLDITNQLPVTKDFLERLEIQSENCKASRLALTLWSLVKGFDYYFWDTVTAAAVIQPDLFSFKEMRIDVSTQGHSQGKTSPAIFGGRKVKVATSVNKAAFEDLVLEILQSR